MTRTVAPCLSMEQSPKGSTQCQPLSPLPPPSPGLVNALTMYSELSDEQRSAIETPTLTALHCRASALDSCLKAVHSLRKAAHFASVLVPSNALEALKSEAAPFQRDLPPYSFEQAPYIVCSAAQDTTRYAHIAASRAQLALRILGLVESGLGCVASIEHLLSTPCSLGM